MSEIRHIAYFVSPHGYGHASRASAVMASISELNPGFHFEIFTQVPPWVFEDSLPRPFDYHPLLTDIGLVQKTPLDEDVPETVRRLNDFLSFDGRLIEELAGQVTGLGCELMICDIAPMGIAVAREAGLPSLLVENFTWDWIYQGYADHDSRLKRHISYLRGWFDRADYHLQTEPVCQPDSVDLTTAPISRKPRTSREQTRQRLGIPVGEKVVIVTMGGISWDYASLENLGERSGVHFIIPGASERDQKCGNLLLLPHHSDFFHPDLVAASDAVIGKLGYSTLAEVYHAGVPFGYIARPRFRESGVLVDFIRRQMSGLPVSEAQFRDGEWVSLVSDLLALPRVEPDMPNGGDQVARFVCDLLR